MKTKPADKLLLIIAISSFCCGFTQGDEQAEENHAADPWQVIQLDTKAESSRATRFFGFDHLG